MINKLRPALVITSREVRDQFRDWRIIFPIVGLTLLFPFLMQFTAQQMLDFVEKYGANIVGERLIPFLLMIVGFFPISVSLVIALETFVGEKERGSIEPLLNTPLEDWQLYLGKLLSATVPPLIGSYLGMAVYLTGLLIKHIALPESSLLILIISLTTIQALVMVSGAVVVSTQATSIRAANLLASLIIIPSALLIQVESVVMFWGHTINTLWWIVAGLVILCILLVRVGLAHFQREELLGREIDVLNLRWMWSVFASSFTGKTRSIGEWYRKVVFPEFKALKTPVLLTTLLVIAGMLIGIQQVDTFSVQLQDADVSVMNQRMALFLQTWPMFSALPVLLICWQNLRVLLVSFILGTLSLGILGVMPAMASLGFVGYLFAILAQNGIPITYFLAFILPHGIIEIPATIISTAAVLYGGAVLATPNTEKPIGEIWLITAASWAKIMVGIVLPLLLIAASIESWITPRVVLWLFK